MRQEVNASKQRMSTVFTQQDKPHSVNRLLYSTRVKSGAWTHDKYLRNKRQLFYDDGNINEVAIDDDFR